MEPEKATPQSLELLYWQLERLDYQIGQQEKKILFTMLISVLFSTTAALIGFFFRYEELFIFIISLTIAFLLHLISLFILGRALTRPMVNKKGDTPPQSRMDVRHHSGLERGDSLNGTLTIETINDLPPSRFDNEANLIAATFDEYRGNMMDMDTTKCENQLHIELYNKGNLYRRMIKSHNSSLGLLFFSGLFYSVSFVAGLIVFITYY